MTYENKFCIPTVVKTDVYFSFSNCCNYWNILTIIGSSFFLLLGTTYK